MAMIYSRPNRNGKNVWYIDYRFTDPDTGARVRKKERIRGNKEDAQASLQSRLTDIRRQKFDGILPEPTCTLEDLWERYTKHAQATKSRQVCEREAGIYKNQLKPRFGKLRLDRITPSLAERFQAERIAGDPENKIRPASPATVNKELQLLKNVVKKAKLWGFIHHNRIAEVQPLKEAPGRVRYLDNGEFEKLLKACPGWIRPYAIIAAYTGMRRGEICGLKREYIDRNNGLIRLDTTKNNESKTIPIHPAVAQVLDSLPVRLDTPYLFAEKNGSPVPGKRVGKAFERACGAADVENFRFHDLRHHFASHLTMKGSNQRTVMELLGHKDPRMSVRYQHLSVEHLREAVISLDSPIAVK